MLSRREFSAIVLGAAAEAALPAEASPRPRLPLFDRHPRIGAALAHVSLGEWPSPVRAAPALGERIGIGRLFVKDDGRCASPYGGGKIRKLELFLADAMRRGKTKVATFGGVGSNHAVATAIYARRLGLDCLLFLVPEPASDHVRAQLLVDQASGAELRLGTIRSAADLAADPIRENLDDAYVIPRGGSSALGNVGFVSAGLEIAGQIAPDAIYVAMGTMGAVAGLSVGLGAAGLGTEVVAVRASSPGLSSEAHLDAAIEETSRFLRGIDPTFPSARAPVRVVADQLGGGYGRETAAGLRAMALARRQAGLSLEPVYTAKALAAIASDAARLRGKTVVFWNTHNAHPLPAGGDPEALPPALRRYFP